MDIKEIKQGKTTEELINFGIINLDKPSGPTSFQVSHLIKFMLNLSKTSHGGTLDPGVSGVLPIMLGRACRLSEYIMHKDKTYVGIMRLHENIDDAPLNKAINKFLGRIMQLPPVRSRVKREIREREIKSFNVLERHDKDVLFESEVQAGTYIRKLCDDIGKEIGGAHMLELRRIKAGIFDESGSFNLYELEDAVNDYKKGDDKKLREMIIPGEIICSILPIILVKKEYLRKLYTGSPLFSSFLLDSGQLKKLNSEEKLCIFCEEKFIGCYKLSKEKEILARPEFVFN